MLITIRKGIRVIHNDYQTDDSPLTEYLVRESIYVFKSKLAGLIKRSPGKSGASTNDLICKQDIDNNMRDNCRVEQPKCSMTLHMEESAWSTMVELLCDINCHMIYNISPNIYARFLRLLSSYVAAICFIEGYDIGIVKCQICHPQCFFSSRLTRPLPRWKSIVYQVAYQW